MHIVLMVFLSLAQQHRHPYTLGGSPLVLIDTWQPCMHLRRIEHSIACDRTWREPQSSFVWRHEVGMQKEFSIMPPYLLGERDEELLISNMLYSREPIENRRLLNGSAICASPRGLRPDTLQPLAGGFGA
jgi:hypothetical protein